VFLPWHFTNKRRSLEAQVDGALVANDSALAIRAVSDGLGLMQFAREYFTPMPMVALSQCSTTGLHRRSKASTFITQAAVK
jgi:hypothetical protein